MAEWKDMAKSLTLAGIGKARDLGQSAKLNLDNVSEEENRKRVLAEIGRKFVAEHPVAPEDYAGLYRQLEAIEQKIQANKTRLEKLKKEE